MIKRFVPRKVHGLLDFATVGFFIAGAETLRMKDAPASIVPSRVMGPAVMAFSLVTDYGDDNELGSLRLISMKKHLELDVAFGLAVGLSPWVFGTWRKGWNYWAPQALVLTIQTFFALTTKTDD